MQVNKYHTVFCVSLTFFSICKGKYYIIVIRITLAISVHLLLQINFLNQLPHLPPINMTSCCCFFNPVGILKGASTLEGRQSRKTPELESKRTGCSRGVLPKPHDYEKFIEML